MWNFRRPGGSGTEQTSSDAMAAQFAFPVLTVLFLFFTGRGGSFLSPKEKEKNGGANQTNEGIGPYKFYRRVPKGGQSRAPLRST